MCHVGWYCQSATGSSVTSALLNRVLRAVLSRAGESARGLVSMPRLVAILRTSLDWECPKSRLVHAEKGVLCSTTP